MKLIIFICIFLNFNVNAVELAMNHSVPKIKMTREVVWAIFSRQVITWSDGTPTVVFVLDDHDPLHDKFSKELLETFPYQLRRSWDRKVYSGTGQAPILVESIESMFEHIIKTPGSIGYLPDKWDGDSVRTSKVIPQ
jgi:ABC-type phosphate transport system substrate-binding protein